MSPNPVRWTALIGVLALLVIGAVVYFIATSATPPVQDAAPSPTSSTTTPHPQVEPPELDQAPTPEPEVEPEVEPGRYSYEKSLRWGAQMVEPPELTPDQQVLADVACNFTAAQYDYDPAQVSDYQQILQRFEPFADPVLYEEIAASVAEYGSIGDYDLWVREGATVSVVCAAAPIGDPVPMTTRGGLQVDAWQLYTRTRVRMDLPDGNPEQTYPTFVTYVAELPGVDGPRVIDADVQGGEH